MTPSIPFGNNRHDPSRVIRAPRGTQLSCKSWLTEAAYRSGYSSDAAFSRAFKAHFGYAPSEAKSQVR